jgi:hypothetical protein
MNRVIKFGVYFLVGLALFSVFTTVLNGGGGGGEPLNGPNSSTAPAATPTPTPEKDDEYYTQEIAEQLDNSNITVLSVGVKNNVTVVRYVPKRPNESAIVEEIGTISVRYSGLIRDGWNVSKLEAKVIPPRGETAGTPSNTTNSSSQSASSPDNNSTNQSRTNKTAGTNGSASSTSNKSREPVATWHVKTKWVADMDGENSSQKYLQKILGSIELEGSGSVSRVGRRGRGAQDPASDASRRGRAPDYPQDEEGSSSQCKTADNGSNQCTSSDGNGSTMVFGSNS